MVNINFWKEELEIKKKGARIMTTAINVARYLLKNDKTGKLCDKTLVVREGRRFYAGNACLNKYLHIAQNLYLAKTGTRLFSDDIYAYDNGGVVPEVQENYAAILNSTKEPELDAERRKFLDKLMVFLSEATLDELIEISHEDNEWIDKHNHFYKEDQIMDSESRVEEYREQYADALFLMEGLIDE